MGPRSVCERPGKARDLGGGCWARQVHAHAEHGVGRAWAVRDQLWGHVQFWVGEGLGHVLGCPRGQVRPVVACHECVCVCVCVCPDVFRELE